MKKCYISGKITGLTEEEASSNFEQAETLVRLLNFIPVNPMKEVSNPKDWQDAMLQDIKILFNCDAIFMLSNWCDSKGARIELEVARILEKEIIYETMTSIKRLTGRI